MKTEDFDDAIKKKINSIHATYNEKEIDRVHNFVSAKKPVSFSSKYGKAILVSAAGMVVTALIVLNLIQLQKHDTLVEKIDTLEKSHESLLQQMHEEKTDSQNAKLTGKFPESENIYAGVKHETRIENDNNNSISETTSTSNPLANNQAETGKIVAHNKTKTDNFNNNKKSNQSYSTEKEKMFSGSEKINRNIENNKLTENSIKANELAKNENELLNKSEFSTDSNSIAIEKQSIDSITNDSVSIALEQAKEIPVIDLQKEDYKNKKNSFPGLQFSVGLSMEKTMRMFGLGVPVQVAFSNNWSVYSGLKIAISHDIKFRDEREFRAREGKEIRTEYGTATKDSAMILNIERTNKLIQIPLALAYNIPLKNDFSLVASAGTDFNLASFHNISYENKYRNNISVTKEIKNVKRPVPLFNNANVSFGLQKRWENIIVQANPYLMCHFRKTQNVTNFPNSAFMPGINFRLMYNI